VFFGRESVGRLLAHRAVSFPLFTILVFLASAVAKEGLAQFAFWAGKKASSRAIAADGWHHRSDAIASALIVIGALVGRTLWWVDGALGLVVSLLILWAAVDIVRDSSSVLLGEAPPDELRQSILAAVNKEYPNVDDVHHLHAHRYGEHVEVTLHLRLPDAMSVRESHEISRRIEARLREDLGLEATVHVEPSGD
jgi:cation diffusion facilitator family transporter